MQLVVDGELELLVQGGVVDVIVQLAGSGNLVNELGLLSRVEWVM